MISRFQDALKFDEARSFVLTKVSKLWFGQRLPTDHGKLSPLGLETIVSRFNVVCSFLGKNQTYTVTPILSNIHAPMPISFEILFIYSVFDNRNMNN